jgi:rod shape-determining protein MreB
MSPKRPLFSITVYVRIWRNRLETRCIESGEVVTSASGEEFSTDRLLVGRFKVAEQRLRDAFGKVLPGRFIRPSVFALMHPVEMVEGGLSEVEERVLLELAASAGARRYATHVGAELSDDAVLQMVRQR